MFDWLTRLYCYIDARLTVAEYRRAKQRNPVQYVATAEYITYRDDECTYWFTHMMRFDQHADGTRSCFIVSNYLPWVYLHASMLRDEWNWRYHGILPSFATKIEKHSAEVVVLHGGKK